MQVVGEVFDGLEGVQKAEELKPHLILLDIGLPTLDGIEVARRIRKLVPESKIVFLSMEDSADVVQEALSLGAQGYVEKARSVGEILEAVDAVCQGSGMSAVDCRVCRVRDQRSIGMQSGGGKVLRQFAAHFF